MRESPRAAPRISEAASSMVVLVTPASEPAASAAGSLTADEVMTLKAFRSQGEVPAAVPDEFVLRFLRARRWKLDDALLQYRDTLAWREEHDVDRWRRDAPGPIGPEAASKAPSCDGVECFPQDRVVAPITGVAASPASRFFHGQVICFGFDRQGRPIYIQKAGIASTRFPEWSAYIKQQGREPMELMLAGWVAVQEMQAARMEESAARRGAPVTQQLVLMDVKGLSYWPDPTAISAFRTFLFVLQRYYPETLGALFFINCPLIFTALWKVIRGWLDPVTVQKVHVLGKGYQATLLEHIAPEQLLVEYGGTNRFDCYEKRTLEQAEEYFASGYGAATRGAAPKPAADLGSF